MKKNIYLFLLFLIVIISSYLRLIGTYTNSFAFTYDVGRDMLKVAEIVYQHKIVLIGFTTGLEGVFYGPWWYYILALPFLISSGDPQFISVFIAFTGISAIIILYLFGKKIESEKLGILFAFFAGFSPSLIGISTQIWNPNIAPLLITASLFLIIKIFQKPSVITFFLYGILTSLLIDTEIVFGLLLFISSLIGLFIVSRKTIISKKSLFFLPGLLLILAPRIIFDLRHGFLMTNNILKLLISQKTSGGGFMLSSVIDKLNIFLGHYAYTITGDLKLAAGLLLTIVIVCTFIIYKKIPKLVKKIFLFSIIVTAVFIVGILFFSHDIWPHYLVGLPVYYCLITAVPLYYAAKNIKYGNFALLILLFILFLVNVKPISIISDLQKPIWEGDASVYRNQIAVVDYVYKQAAGKPFNYIAYSPAVFSYPYDYLFSWYGPKKYKYTPAKEHQKLFFVIIEPEHERPVLLKDWLKLREKDGKIIKEQKVKGGVVVQTRMH